MFDPRGFLPPPPWEQPRREPSPIGFVTTGKGPIEGYYIEFGITLMREEDTGPDLWKRMGSRPFYRIYFYTRYLDQHLEGYFSEEEINRVMRR